MQPDPWRYILHADLDAFYASVEQLDNPRYRGLPLVVGGSPTVRGVVAASSYEARKFGIRSAMPMRTAFRLHPPVIRVPPRFDRYRELSEQVMAVYRALTPLVEPLSLDEAYLDISEQVPRGAVQRTAAELKSDVLKATGLPVTVGGGISKTVAKIASQLGKPDGLLLVRPGEEVEFLRPLDVGLLWGVGEKSAELLRRYGIDTIGDLADRKDAWLIHTFGKRGPEFKERALGLDREPVVPSRETKSVSSETTFPTDVGSRDRMEASLKDLSDEVSARLKKEGLRGKTVSIKLRLSDFTTFTRQQTSRTPIDDASDIFRSALSLLRREMKPGLEFRLLGVGVSGFQDFGQLPLFSLDEEES